MGKISQWLGSKQSKSAELAYPPAHLTAFDSQRIRGFRHALNSRSLGAPQQDYLNLTSHMTGLVHLAINLIATLTQDSSLSLWEYEDGSDRAVRLKRDDPIMRLYASPNRIDTTQDFLYDQVVQHELAGQALIWTPPDRDPNLPGVEISEMWVLPRAGMILNPPTPGFPQGYWTALPYGMYGNPAYGMFTSGARIPSEQVVVFQKRHPYYRWEGYSILSAMAQSVSTFEALETSRLSALQQGCEQSVSVEFPESTTQPLQEVMDGIRSQWYAENAGPNNAGKLLFTSRGTKINRFSTTPAEMAYTESFDQLSDYLLATFGTPKAIVGMVDELTHSTLFGTLKANYLTKLRPLLNKLSARHTKDILHPFYSDSVFMRLDADAIHDDELKERQLDNDLSCGAILVGEVREAHGYDLTGEPWEKERAFRGSGPAILAKGGSEQRDPETGEHLDADDKRDFDAEVGRVSNAAGAGALGPRMKRRMKAKDRASELLGSMEGLKSRGVINDLTDKAWSNGVSLNGKHGDKK